MKQHRVINNPKFLLSRSAKLKGANSNAPLRPIPVRCIAYRLHRVHCKGMQSMYREVAKASTLTSAQKCWESESTRAHGSILISIF